MKTYNAAFSGGGLSSVVGLGAYSEMKKTTTFDSFSGASIGSVIAATLAAGKTPEQVRDFLAENVEGFCAFILGRKRIERKTNEFLGNLLFRNLPKECIVSITPLRSSLPKLITRENAEDLTVGKVVALSSALPGLFLPGIVKLEGKRTLVLDGGLTANPPLKENALNVVFSFKRSDKVSKKPWNVKKAQQEAKANILIKPMTHYGTLGKHDDVFSVFEEGQKAVQR